MKKNSFIEGTIIASLAIIITKILGVLYVIPFYSIIGEDGGVLYSYAYNIYNLFLNIATAGIPVAISMVISEYQTLDMQDAKRRTYKISKKIIAVISIIAFLVLFIFAEQFANFFLSGIEGGNSLQDVGLVIRAISTCLLIIPFLSVLRGFIQGNKIITPTSISQVIEQLVRVIIIVFGSYISINYFHASTPVAVSVALSGAFFGGLAAYLYLRFKVNKNKELFETKVEKKDNVSNKEIVKKIIFYCIPLIITSIITNLYDLIDMKLVIKGLYMIDYPASDAELIASIIATWGPKICMVIVAISMGLTTSLIPHMIESFTKGDKKDVNHKFNQAIKTILFITIPMALGLFLLADEAYYLFYGENTYGPLLLRYLAILNIFTAVLTVMNTALQGMKKFKIIYINSIAGLAINAILDIPLILLFNAIGIYPFYGTVTATIIGCSLSYLIVFIYLKKTENFSFKPIISSLKKLVIPVVVMSIIVYFLEKISNFLPANTLGSLITILVCALVGALVYAYLTYKNGSFKDIMGNTFQYKLTKILKMGKRKNASRSH